MDNELTLHEKQVLFPLMISKLIEKANSLGYDLTFGDAYRDPRVSYGHPTSLHKLRLAVDFNLFSGNIYLKDNEDHQPLGEYWESLGGTWGGRFGDGNHYSLAHQGMK